MKKLIFKILFITLLIFTISCEKDDGLEQEIERITIIIYDKKDKKPIEDLYVILEGNNEVLYTDFSNKQGTSYFTNVEASFHKMRLLIYGEATSGKVYYWDSEENGHKGGIDFYVDPIFSVNLESQN